MIESGAVKLGLASPDQSKVGSATTDRAILGAESVSLRLKSGLWSSRSVDDAPGPQSGRPSTARAYGSSSSLCGLHRNPADGFHGPSTRYPYRCPGPTPS